MGRVLCCCWVVLCCCQKSEFFFFFFFENTPPSTSSPEKKSKHSPFRGAEPLPLRVLDLQVPQRGPEHAVDDRPRPQRLGHRRVGQTHPAHGRGRQQSTEIGDDALLLVAELAHQLRPRVELAQEARDGGSRRLVAGEELGQDLRDVFFVFF